MPTVLKPSYEAIAQALAVGSSMEVAYKAGGYSYNPSSASRTCNRLDIKTRVQEIMDARAQAERQVAFNAAESLGITKRWVLDGLKRVAELALSPRVIREAKGKKPAVYGKPDLAAANRSFELMGRELGMFIERHEIGGVGEFQRYNDQELQERAISDARAMGFGDEAIEHIRRMFAPPEPLTIDHDPEESSGT